MKKILSIILLLFLTACSNHTLKDDYYQEINKQLLKPDKVKEGEYTWSTFTEAQDKVDKQTDKIIDKIEQNQGNNNLNILKHQLLDSNMRNNQGLASLKPYLDKIDSSNDINTFVKTAIYIEKELSLHIFTNISVAPDFKNTNNNIIYFYPLTFDFNASADYYINEDYMPYKALIKQYGIKILKQYGHSKEQARNISKELTNMYIDISQHSLLQKDLTNVSNYYNIITKEELQQIYTNLDINYYLKEWKLENTQKFSIVDQENYRSFNQYLTKENLPLLKEYVKLKILESYAPYLSENYASIVYELNNKLSGIEKDTKTQEERANSVIKSFFTYDIDVKYQEQYFTKEQKNYINSMIKDIINYYENNIQSLDWLSKSTKQKAITKLKNMKVNIGLKSDYPTYSKDYNLSENNTLIENIIKISKTINDYERSKLNNDKKEQALSQTTVNAYYNPQDNSINFPVASTNLFDIHNSYYQNLGSIGMVIAHEITHAFDSNGAKFDEFGNLNNWWTKEDKKNYQTLQIKVIKYYNQFQIGGQNINGTLTSDENIADLGAVSCITNIAKQKNATKDQMKQMYESFSNMWASVSNKEYEKILLLQDTHSPAKYRVNATLSSIDEFYKVYNLKAWDEMYIAKSKRVKVW